MLIPPLSPAVRAYIAKFNITAIVTWRDGRVGTTRDPRGAESAVWVRDCNAGDIMRLARRNGSKCNAGVTYGDVEAAARELRITVTTHARMIERVTMAVGAIESEVALARTSGRLKFFNREFKRRRLAAAAAGERFLTYDQATRRLRNAIASVAAGDVKSSIVTRVFGG